MVRCRVLHCVSDSEKKIAGVSFHAFPDSPDLRQKWIAATGRKMWSPSKYCKICSNHFPESMLIKKPKKTVLYPDALPNKITTSDKRIDPVSCTSSGTTPFRTLVLPEEEDTPRKKRLKLELRRKTMALSNLRKKIRAVCQFNRRLRIRNAQLLDIILELKIKSLYKT